MMTVINASAAATVLEQRPKKKIGSERDSNPRPRSSAMKWIGEFTGGAFRSVQTF